MSSHTPPEDGDEDPQVIWNPQSAAAALFLLFEITPHFANRRRETTIDVWKRKRF